MKTKTNTKIKDIWGTRSLFEDFKKMFFLLFIITVPLIFFTNPKRTDDIQQEKIHHKSEPMINYWKQFRDDFKNEKVMTKKESEFSNYQENYYYDENTHSANYKITQKPSNEIDLNNQEQSDDIESIDSQDFINDVEPKDSTNDSQDKINDVVPKKHILRVREKFNVDPELKMLEKTIEENQFTNRKRIRENRERAKVAKETNSNEIKNIQVNLHEYLNKTNANIILSKPFTSPTYSNLPITKFFVNIMKFVLREKEIWNYPINAISDNMKEGHCFSFEGQRGNITIDLKTSLLVKAISIEHPKTEHPSSTPKTFSVFSFSAQSIDQLFQYKDHEKEIASNVEFPKNNIGPKIYSFTPVETRFIQFRFLENHGDPHYTCIYRLNVYV